jgi:hypothetical protein
MRKVFLAAVLAVVVAGSAWGADGPAAVVVNAEGNGRFVIIDKVVVNLNGVAAISYWESTGSLTVLSLNGTATVLSAKLTAEEWKKIQVQIVKASGG